MYLGQEFRVTDWFYINFVENPGMAFGLEFGGDWGKLALTIFRIVAVVGIGYYIWLLIKKQAPSGLVWAMSLIFAGALGNIIDSVFYGIMFSGSAHQIATFFPLGGGYGTWFHGRVVDMLYFPLISGYFPDWVPIWGGEYFSFFRPVFNIADTSISVGVGLIILFQKKFFAEEKTETASNAS